MYVYSSGPCASIVDPGATLPAVLEQTGMGCCGACADRQGLGYFDTGFDISGWGWMEWGTVIFGVYSLSSLFFDVKRTTSRVSGSLRKRGARRSKIAAARRRYEKELETA